MIMPISGFHRFLYTIQEEKLLSSNEDEMERMNKEMVEVEVI